MSKDKLNNAKDRATARSLLPLVAIGGGLAATPAAALELGEITVQSNLGQPLRASIAYALAPNEMLSNTCVSVSSGRSTSGLPGIGASSVRITERAIMITGQSPIREPMLATRVTIDCPYTPNLSREYMLLVDPVNLSATSVAAPAASVPAARPEAAPVARPEAAPVVRSEPAPVARPAPATPVSRAPVNNTPIGQSTRYQVQPGDSLSEIVARIENRSVSLWPAVNMIFAANPEAFINNDPNKLKAGSWLTIPSLDGTAPVVNVATPDPVSPPAEIPAPVADASVPAEITAPAADISAPAEVPAPAADVSISAPDSAVFDETGRAAEEPFVSDSTADLMPGDTVAEIPAAPAAETIVIPDTELEGPQTTSSSPNVPTAIVSTGTRSESTSLLTWLIGGGLALILALLLFGRRIRERLSGDPAMAVAPVADGYSDDDAVLATDETSSDAAMLVESAMHFDIDDDSPTDENIALDADLVAGTGLEEGEMAVAHDFGFAQTTELDVDLPFESSEPLDTSASMIEPLGDDMNVASILDSEVLPGSDDDIEITMGGDTVETLKMPMPESEETEPQLEAIDPAAVQDAADATIEQDSALSLLEQDYEDELTATQALNREIERAAAQLTSDLDPVDVDGDTEKMPLATVEDTVETAEMPLATVEDTVETAEMPMATVTELDSTTELRKKDADETAEFEAAHDSSDTTAMTIRMTEDEKTNRMPVANDDETVEMDIEGGKVDTSKR